MGEEFKAMRDGLHTYAVRYDADSSRALVAPPQRMNPSMPFMCFSMVLTAKRRIGSLRESKAASVKRMRNSQRIFEIDAKRKYKYTDGGRIFTVDMMEECR
jgi:hypothetical protein